MTIGIGIGGWVYEDWRGVFYPEGLSQKKELAYAASKLTSIEINGTYYGSQKPETYRKWRDETPEGFVFTLKGSRFATNRKDLSQSKDSVEKFLTSGISELGPRLGPINWQFMATKKFDAEDFTRFFNLLPKSVDGVDLRHAVEVRHESFQCAEFVELARQHNVGIITSADGEYPQIADLTSDFAYIRAMGTTAEHEKGYSDADLDAWAMRIKTLSKGSVPNDLQTFGSEAKTAIKDVFFYVISGHKVLNPLAAMALIEKLK